MSHLDAEFYRLPSISKAFVFKMIKSSLGRKNVVEGIEWTKNRKYQNLENASKYLRYSIFRVYCLTRPPIALSISLPNQLVSFRSLWLLAI